MIQMSALLNLEKCHVTFYDDLKIKINDFKCVSL